MTERPLVIDGFSSVQAVRRSGRAGGPRFAESRTRLAASEKKPDDEQARAGAPGARIGHSAIPQRYDIVCYACGYRFDLRGKLRKTFCPKCREELDIGEHTIEDEFSGRIQTIGTVTVAPGGLIKDAHIVTGDLVLDGRMESGEVRVCRRLHLGPHAAGAIHRITAADIHVHAGANVSLRATLRCANLAVSGELRATLEVGQCAVVLPGGCLRGALRAARLVVREGGGLKASLRVAPGAVAPPDAPPSQPQTKANDHASKTRSRSRTGSAHSRRGGARSGE